MRVGIVILLTGLVFLGNYAYHELVGRIGPAGKLALLYLAGAGLGALGGWLARRNVSLRNYGRVLLAGGCATIYYATYAAHFVAPLRVVESPLVGGALLLALGSFFVIAADRRHSQLLAGTTIFLSYYTAAINSLDTFSLFSNLVISVAAVTLLARRRWASVTFLSLLGSYGSFLFWRTQQTHSFLPPSPLASGDFWIAVLFPAAYWAVHTVAVLLRRLNGLEPTARPAFLTLNNAAFFGLAGPLIAATHPGAFWLAAIAFGGLLLALAAVAARREPDDLPFDRTFLTQGLALVLLGVFTKFSGWQLALGFALMSGTLISLGRRRHGPVYRFFAGVSALVAAIVALGALQNDGDHARLTTWAVAAILLANGWLLKRSTSFHAACDWRVFGFAVLSGILAASAAVDGELFASGVRLLALAGGATLLVRLHRLPEAAYVAQPLAFLGQVLLAIRFAIEPGANLPLVMCGIFALGFVHFWQFQTASGLAGRRFWPALHCLAPVALAIGWSHVRFAPDQRAPVLALIALGILAYAFVTRAWVLIGAGIPITLVTVSAIGSAILQQGPWLQPGMAITLLAAQSLVLTGFEAGAPFAAGTLLTARRTLRAVAFVLGVAMVFAYVPDTGWFPALSGLGLGFFLFANASRSGEALVQSASLGTIAVVVWIGRLSISPASWPDIFGLAAFAVAQQIGRRGLAARGWFAPGIQAFLCTFAGLGTWILVHRVAAEVAGGFLMTIVWSLLAMGLLITGLALKERAYRLLGLGILAAAVGRIVLLDVWQLDTLFRILSFLVLGAVLLALGFIYNRFAATLRQWL